MDTALGICSFHQPHGQDDLSLVVRIRDGEATICGRCVSAFKKVVDTGILNEKSFSRHPTPRAIRAALDQHVVRQEGAKKILATAVHNHYKRIDQPRTIMPAFGPGAGSEDLKIWSTEIEKSNILLIGPTGSGKTLMAEKLGEFLKVPMVAVDATALTQAGYVGEDVESIIAKLLAKAGGDVHKAQRGIVFIDEIDKTAKTSAANTVSKDIGGEGVQQALLKIIEGTVVRVPAAGRKKNSEQEQVTIPVDTTDILFICGGAFNGLADIVERRVSGSSGIGFNAAVRGKAAKPDLDRILKEVMPGDLTRFGMIPEFVGRLPVIAVTQELTVPDLVGILTEPKNALVKQYRALMRSEGIRLDFTGDALREIAGRAGMLGTGARGLRSIVEGILLDPMFDCIGTYPEVARITVTAAAVRGEAPPEIRYREKAQPMKAGFSR